MSIVDTTQSKNPFAALADRRQKEVDAEAEAANQQRALQRAAAEAAEAEHRARVRHEHLVRQVQKFGRNFMSTLQGKVSEWSPAQILEAGEYAQALLMPGENEAYLELPKVSDFVAEQVRNIFTFGLALAESGIPNIMETRYFAAQRQDWFNELFEEKRGDAKKYKERHATSTPQDKPMHYSTSSSTDKD